MPRKNINFELDFMKKDIFPRFTVKQFDDVSFNIKPKNQGLDYDTTGMTGKIFVGVNNDMFMQTTGITVSSNNIKVLLDKNMLQNRGRAYAEIELTDSHGTITSSSFIFNIDEKIGEGSKIPEGYEGFVKKYERLISEFKTQVNSTINNCNTNVNSAIKQCNTNVDNKLNTVDSLINVKISDFEKRFNRLTSSQQQDAEVIDARDGETSLKARLDRDIEKAKQVYVNVEGSNISTDSSSGYLKDVEIKGNTIQDIENLADIRSVGDTVEGQELYEIPVLSCGKNLMDEDNFTNPDSYNICSFYVKVLGNTYYRFSHKDSKSGTILDMEERDANGDVIVPLKGIWHGSSITTNANTSYLRIKSNIANKGSIMMCMENSTEYEPYQEDKITILSPVQLEKVGDVADRIICKDGVWGVEKNIMTKNINSKEYSIATTVLEPGGSRRMLFALPNAKDTNSETPISNFNTIPYTNSWDTKVDAVSFGLDGKSFLVYLFIEDYTVDKYIKKLDNLNIITKYPTTTPQFIPLPHDQQVKLRTFDNKTNISFLTEIEGTIKAQVPKSLGATVNTHTEQISNLNKELDRVKKLEESTVSTVETESDFTTVEATSNGYFEDVKLKGKTLVNLAYGNIDKTFTANGVQQTYKINATQPFKVNTSYTIIASCDKCSVNGDGIRFSNYYLGGGSDTSFINKIGTFAYVFNTGSNPIDVNSITVYIGTSNTTGEINIKNVIILEGDHTQNLPSFFEGIKSVGDDTDEIVVSSVNENLFDGEVILNAKFENNGSITQQDNAKGCVIGKNFIKVNSKLTYKLNSNKNFRSYLVCEYDKDKNFICRKDAINDNKLSSNCEYVRIYCYTNDTSLDLTNLQIMFNEGDSFKPYTQHESDKKRLLFYNNETQTWEKPILREWDSIEKHSDGKYYYHQRSGEVVLNGSENWWHLDTYVNNTNYIRFKLEGVITNAKNNSDCMCDKFKSYPGGTSLYGVNDSCVAWYMDNRFQIKLQDNVIGVDNGANDLDKENALKAWLQTNNVTVVYQLAEEKVYECTNIDLVTYANETNYIVESGAISPKTTLKVHNNISNVVSLLQKKVSILESNMTKYMITQNRMQLASTYSADSVTFKVDYALCSEEVEYNEDLYNLILNNILVGKDNYDYDKMFTMVLDYASWNQISWEQFDILVGLMDIQHNPPIEEIPTDDEIVEEIPNEIM